MERRLEEVIPAIPSHALLAAPGDLGPAESLVLEVDLGPRPDEPLIASEGSIDPDMASQNPDDEISK